MQGLRFARRRFAGAERGSRLSQEVPTKSCCERVRSTKGAPRNPFGVLEGRHGLAEISERGAGVLVERPCVIRPHPERIYGTLPVTTSRQGHRFAQQCLGFFELRRAVDELGQSRSC